MKIKIFIKRLFLGLVTVFVLGSIVFGLLIKKSLPKDDGVLSSTHLKAEVHVYKDQWGIPHINASNEHDAIFAYGYTVAKDRLFQMDLQRRLSQGRLAELLGDDLVDIDIMFRTYLFKNWSENYIKNNQINPQALSYVESFIKGVNCYIENGVKPFEYYLLNADIAPFTTTDVASMTAYMAFTFMDGIRFDGLYTMLKEKIGAENCKILFPDYADNNYLTIKEENVDSIPKRVYQTNKNQISTDSSLQLSFLYEINDKAQDINPPFHGSNSWILSSKKSKNGKPILANDPHIGISKPDVWYEAHISYPGHNNYGYYVPMIPFPLIGHDDGKAWGLTMFENDELDLYSETFHPENKNQVLAHGNWVDCDIIQETISTSSGKDTTISIQVTSNGPIVTKNLKYYEGAPISMFWVFYQLENPIFDILHELSHAKTMDDFKENLSKVISPGLNFSYADTSGNIAWWAAGKLPVRNPNVHAKEILNANDSNHLVLSYVPFEKNPHLVNPEHGIIVTANNLSTTDSVGDIPRLDGYFRSTDRAERILSLLKEQDKWSTEELQKVQTDVQLWSAEKMKNIICNALKSHGKNHSKDMNPVALRALESLENWDGIMDINSVGTSVFMVANYHIMKYLLINELDEEYIRLYLNRIDHWDFLRNFLFRKTVPFNIKESQESIIYNGFINAINELTVNHGNIENWKWGNLHHIEFEHPLGKQKPLNNLFNIGPFGVNGGFNAVNKIMSHQGDHTYKVSSLPSTRRLIDLGNPSKSYSVLPSGNSGHFQSEHYDDQINLFLNGDYRNLNFTPKQVETQKTTHFKLLPLSE